MFRPWILVPDFGHGLSTCFVVWTSGFLLLINSGSLNLLEFSVPCRVRWFIYSPDFAVGYFVALGLNEFGHCLVLNLLLQLLFFLCSILWHCSIYIYICFSVCIYMWLLVTQFHSSLITEALFLLLFHCDFGCSPPAPIVFAFTCIHSSCYWLPVSILIHINNVASLISVLDLVEHCLDLVRTCCHHSWTCFTDALSSCELN